MVVKAAGVVWSQQQRADVTFDLGLTISSSSTLPYLSPTWQCASTSPGRGRQSQRRLAPPPVHCYAAVDDHSWIAVSSGRPNLTAGTRRGYET